MVSRIGRSSITPSSNESGHSLPSPSSQPKEDRPAHHRARPPPARSSSANPHRSSHRPVSGHAHKLSDTSPHPALDLAHHSTKDKSSSTQAGFSSTPTNLNMFAQPPRFHSPLPPPSQGYTSRSHVGNRHSMQPSQSQPSFQSFAPRDPRREMLQPHAKMASGQFGHQSNRQSRHLDLPMRRANEPVNLIQSVRDTPQSSRPNSVQVDPRRVVTGVLQSALPPSSRPVPINTEPVRSMSIAELEHRHKVKLQKLQAHSNQQVAKSSGIQSPSGAQSRNVELNQRHKAAMQKLQGPGIPAVVTTPPISSGRKSVNPPPRTASQPKAPASSSDTSSKSTHADQSEKKSEKGNIATSNRRSIFGFLSFKESKSAAGSTEDTSTKPKSLLSSKKQKKEAVKPDDEKVEEEDEDVPLAQLANRRASYNPAALSRTASPGGSHSPNESLVSKSHSVPGMMNKMGTRDSFHEFGSRPLARPDHLRSHTNPIDNRHSRRSFQQHDRAGGFQPIREDNELAPIDQNLPGRSDLSFQPPRWLDADLDYSQKQGPRPLIFEDEAKAIRNSKRFWS